MIYSFRIQVQYGSTWGSQHGGFSGSCKSITLFSNEVITRVDIGTAFSSQYHALLTCDITFYTNKATYGPYIGPQSVCTTHYTFNLVGGLAYLRGDCGDMLDGLRLAYYN